MPVRLFLTALTLLSLTPSLHAQVPEFSFKGLRLGMPITELADSLQSPTFFLKPPRYIEDFVGDAQKKIDTLTKEAKFYGPFRVGCVAENGYTDCASYEVLYVRFMNHRVVGLTLSSFDVTFIENLLELSATGIVAKIGEPVEDRRAEWKESDVDEAIRQRTHVFARWEIEGEADTVRGAITFRPAGTEKDKWNEYTSSFYPVHDVTMAVSLYSRADQEWYDAAVKWAVASREEAERIVNEKRVTPDF